MTEERLQYISLALTSGVGDQTFLALLKHFHSAQAVLSADYQSLIPIVKKSQTAHNILQQQSKQKAEETLEWLEKNNTQLLTLHDNQYPIQLAQGISPPPLLFARGNIQLLEKPSLAIVGSRHATHLAKQTTYNWAQELSAKGLTIISGLAEGIDTAAHEGALTQEGKTIAVVGTGIDRVYPASNYPLAHLISTDGLLLSEFPLNTRPIASNFPRRNRIIAALSQATIVIEAAIKSGSLITARLANDMGKEVFAMPGSIHQPQSKGCHYLIKQGAKLLESTQDLFDEMPYLTSYTTTSTSPAYSKNITPDSKNESPLNKDDLKNQEKCSTLNKVGFDPIHPDELSHLLNISIPELQIWLLQLELEGKIVSLPCGKFQRLPV